MKKLTLLLLLFSVFSFSQEKKEFLTLKDGWYTGNNQCTYQRTLGANTIYKLVWVQVKDSKVIYIGKGKSSNAQNNFLENYQLTEVPFIKKSKKKDKYFAEYKYNRGRTTNLTDNAGEISCKIYFEKFMSE